MAALEAYLNKFFNDNADTLRFESEEGKKKVIKEMERRFTMSGESIVNANTGALVEQSVFESVVYSLSSPHLSVRGKGKYVPLFADTRTPEQRAKHKAEVEKLVDFYLEAKGYAFRFEHLGDFTIRQSIKNAISANFLYEGIGTDGEVVLRKYRDGMLSKEFDPNEVIDSYAKPFTDHSRTIEKQKRLKQDGKHDLKPITYTKKTLPKYNQEQIAKEYERRALFKHGLPGKHAATLNQLKMIEGYTNDGIARVNSFNPAEELKDLARYNTPRESWDIEPENKSGYFLPSENL